MNNTTCNLMEGSIIKSILLFSIPLFLSNLFQQFYNTVDAYFVGNYLDKISFAAVGVCSPIMNLIIGLFVGLSAGASVVVSQGYGDGSKKRLTESIQCVLLIMFGISMIITIVGLLFSNSLLNMMNTPEELLNQAKQYLIINFLGITFTIIYNFISAILRACGDGKRPFYFLIISSVIHILLNYVFILWIPLGVSGVAISTVLSQGCSALMAVYVLIKHYKKYIFQRLPFNYKKMNQTLKIALPAGLQQCIGAISNIVVQTYINSFGAIVVAGYSAAIKIDSFVVLPILTLNIAITIFVSQNLGANKKERVKEGIIKSLIMAVVTMIVLSIILYIFGNQLLSLFNKDFQVIESGRLLQVIFLPYYFVLAFVQILSGALRGQGVSLTPSIIITTNFLVIRWITLIISNLYIHTINSIYYSQPITWISCALMMILTYFYLKKKQKII